MLRGIGLDELDRKIKERKEEKRDFVTDTRNLIMGVVEDPDKKPSIVLGVKGKGTYPILPLAHDQIEQRLKIGGKYYDRMAQTAPGLLAANVNHWFQQKPEMRMVRTLSSNTRAFLSNRYNRIENEQIAAVAMPVLQDLPGVQIPSCEVTDKRLYIHFVVPSITAEVRVGDVVQAGGVITNSEVGLGSVSVAGLIWRLRCLNGLKTDEAFRRHHVGREIDEGELEWADDTRRADDATVLLKVRDMVRAVVDETRFRVTLDKLKGLSTANIKGNPIKAVEELAQKFNATETEKGGIFRALTEGADLSAWGLINAVTTLAHTASTYDRAVELEAVGGSLVELPPAEWKRVLEAA